METKDFVTFNIDLLIGYVQVNTFLHIQTNYGYFVLDEILGMIAVYTDSLPHVNM